MGRKHETAKKWGIGNFCVSTVSTVSLPCGTQMRSKHCSMYNLVSTVNQQYSIMIRYVILGSAKIAWVSQECQTSKREGMIQIPLGIASNRASR